MLGVLNGSKERAALDAIREALEVARANPDRPEANETFRAVVGHVLKDAE